MSGFLVDHTDPVSPHHVPTVPEEPALAGAREDASRTLRVRRGLVVAAPVLAGLACVVGAVFDPAAGESGQEMYRTYAAHPEPLQLKSLGYHWAYAFWIGTALLVTPWVRARGSVLATLGAVLGFAGMTTLPGLLAVDWYDSAVGQLHGVEAVGALHEHMDATMWGLPYFMLPGIVGLALALPLSVAGLARAGVVHWWSLAAVVGAFVVFLASQATWWGAVGTLVLLTVLAVDLARGTRGGVRR